MSLSEAIQELGCSPDIDQQRQIVDQTLHHFIKTLGSSEWHLDAVQSLHDLALLRKLVTLHGTETWKELVVMLENKAKHLKLEVCPLVA